MRRKRTIRAVALILVTAGEPAGLVSARAQQVFRSGVQTVFVDVSVSRNRTPVTTLSAADFTVSDNGAPQQIEVLANTAIPLDVSLVVDASWYAQGLAGASAGPGGTDILHRNAQQIAGLLQPEDRLGVITFAADLVETRPMTPVGPNPARISVENPESYSLNARFRITQGLLTALMAPVAPDRRHVVVLFTVGRGEPDVPPLEHLVPAAERADALLYSVVTPPLQDVRTHQPGPLFPYEVVVRDAVTKAAEATGGKAYLTGDIVGAFRDVLREFRRSYVLRYTVEGVTTGGWHKIGVKVPSCSDCTVRARRGYMGK